MKKILLASLMMLSFHDALAKTEPHKPVSQDNPSMELKYKNYDDELYEVAYKTFLANGNIKDAYELAKHATIKRPHFIRWHRRLAKVARWNSKPEVSLAHYEILAVEHHDSDALNKAIELATELNDFNRLQTFLKRYLEDHGQDYQALGRYINLEEQLGRPENAIALIKRYLKLRSDTEYLKKLATLQKQIGDFQQEAQTLELMINSNHDVSWALKRQAQGYIDQGQYKDALASLLKINDPKFKDKQYWEEIGNLAWIMQEYKLSLQAYQTLYQEGNIEKYNIGRYFDLLVQQKMPQRFKVAKEAWEKYHEPSFFLTFISHAVSSKNWLGIAQHFSELNQHQKAALQVHPYYWEVLAETQWHLGQTEMANQTYLSALTRFPNSAELKVAYLWHLLNSHQTQNVQEVLGNWSMQLHHTDKTNEVMSQALLKLGRPGAATSLLEQDLPNNINNLPWLNRFSDTLQQAHYTNLAHEVRIFALEHNQNAELKDRYHAFKTLVPGDEMLAALERIKSEDPSLGRELALEWALEHRYDDMARHIAKQVYAGGEHEPSWAALNRAITEHDMPTMEKVMTRSKRNLPVRDHFQAAQQISAFKQAGDIAYKGLEETPLDDQLYNDFAQFMDVRANHFSVSQSLQQFATIRGPRYEMESYFFLTPRLLMLRKGWLWSVTKSDASQLANAKQNYVHMQAAFRYFHSRGFTQLSVSQNSLIDDFFSAQLRIKHRLTHRLTIDMKTDINAMVHDTAGLYIGGAKDDASLDVIYDINHHTQAFAQLNAAILRDQSRHKLANNINAYGSIEHKFRIQYPDWTIAAFYSWHRYSQKSSVPGSLLKLVPSTDTPNIDLFIPQNFTQYGVQFYFGEVYQRHYTRGWKPFARIEIFNNSQSGFGYGTDIGFATSLKGRDHLAIFFDFSSNANAVAGNNWFTGARYMKYL